MQRAQRVGKRIKRLRELASMSKSELARSVDVSPTAVNNWEEHGVMPRMEVILKLQKVLEVSWMQLTSAFADDDVPAKDVGQTKFDNTAELSRGQRLENYKHEIAALFGVEPARVDIVIRT